jgi:DNA-binding MarR family transcriptional regulator
VNLGDVFPAADFGLALRRVAIAFHRHRLAAARAAFGIGAREAAALGELFVDGPLTPTDLAARLNVTTAAVTELADRLEHTSYISRAQHPTDRRRVTDEARQTLVDEWAGYTHVVSSAAGGLDPDAERVVIEVLGDAATALDRARQVRAGDRRSA